MFVAAIASATGALGQTAPAGDPSLLAQRGRFDHLYEDLPPALDDAITKLEAVPVHSSGPEWATARAAVLRENAIWPAIGETLRDGAARARADARPDMANDPYLKESIRESQLFVPLVQKEVLLAHLLIAKRPTAEPGSPARLAGNGSVTINPADYPAYAIRMDHEGRTSFRLPFGADGRAISCMVTTSSGYAELDDATCRLMKARARFAVGRSGVYLGALSWRIPASHGPAMGMQPDGAQPYAAQQVPDQATPAYQLGKAQAAAALGSTPER